MIGLIYILFLAVYFWLSVKVVREVAHWAEQSGRGSKRWAWVAGIGMYLLVFWDLIPTHAVHQYYCATESGFSIYQTLKQWKQENPGVAETLEPIRNAPWIEMEDKTRIPLNQRFAWDRYEKHHLLGVRERDEHIVDTNTGVMLARYVDFDTDVLGVERGTASRGLRDYKFWLAARSCEMSGNKVNRKNFYQYEASIEKIGSNR